MTTSDFRKAFTQLNSKPNVKKKYFKFNSLKKRSCGKGLRKCRRCGRNGAFIQKYGLKLCRQCFREIAQDLGFKKYG